MKTILSLASLFFFSIIFTSCVKTVDISTPPVTSIITRTWYVSNASSYDGYDWYNFNADLPGVFSFYDNGTAQYEDNDNNMQGYWSSNLVSTDYYDANGNYQTELHKDFKINVSGSYGGYVQLYFDAISFAGNNQFIATFYDGKNIQRYTFTRY